MELVILSDITDNSARHLHTVAEQTHHNVELIFYKNIKNTTSPLPSIQDSNKTILIPRYPYIANQPDINYLALLTIILERYEFARIFDENILRRHTFLEYDDKLFQTHQFATLHLPHAPLLHPRLAQVNDISFPLIAKKRISSRGSGNRILYSSDELEEFIYTHQTQQYIFQPFYTLRSDYRVLVLKDTILGTAEREIRTRKNKASVRYSSHETIILPQHILDQCLTLTRYIGADLCGIDIGLQENGEYFFIEYNLSPQFTSFEKYTGILVSQHILLNVL